MACSWCAKRSIGFLFKELSTCRLPRQSYSSQAFRGDRVVEAISSYPLSLMSLRRFSAEVSASEQMNLIRQLRGRTSAPIKDVKSSLVSCNWDIGASSGIGAETSRVLAMRGVNVILGVRNLVAGTDVKEAIMKEIPTAKVDVMELDLSSMASVRKFVADFNSLNLPLNILINNAGVGLVPFMLSQDGIELQFATNHLGHFLLTDLLLENMKNTACASGIEGRIVIVSSDGYLQTYREGIRFDKINDKSGYGSFAAYGQSKLANILHAQELSNHLKGAATTCYVALYPQVRGMCGKYFADCNLAELKAHATDTNLAKRLWDFSLSLIN